MVSNDEKVSAFIEDIVGSAMSKDLVYNQVFSGLIRATAVFIVSHKGDVETESSLQEVLSKYVLQLQDDIDLVAAEVVVKK